MVPLKTLVKDISRVREFPEGLLLGRNRAHKVIRCRQALVFVLRRKTRLSYEALGRMLDRDHSTLIHCVDITDNLLRRRDPDMVRAYRTVVRCYVKLDRREAQLRAELRQSVEGMLHEHV